MYLDYYKELIEVVITYKNLNNYNLDEILLMLSDDDKDIIKLACQDNGLSLQYASNNLKNDYDIVKTACIQNGCALKFASNSLKNNKNIVSIVLFGLLVIIILSMISNE